VISHRNLVGTEWSYLPAAGAGVLEIFEASKKNVLKALKALKAPTMSPGSMAGPQIALTRSPVGVLLRL
jgi:hypothetical protein